MALRRVSSRHAVLASIVSSRSSIAQERELRNRQALAATAAMAHEMAHQINNPLQTLTNLMFLSENGVGDIPAQMRLASVELDRLSDIVRQLVSLKA